MPISEVAGASKEAVNHPSHYAAHYRREVIELTSHFDFTTGNALKYVLRCRFKGRPTEDLQKAHWYLNYFSDHPESGFLKSEGSSPCSPISSRISRIRRISFSAKKPAVLSGISSPRCSSRLNSGRLSLKPRRPRSKR